MSVTEVSRACPALVLRTETPTVSVCGQRRGRWILGTSRRAPRPRALWLLARLRECMCGCVDVWMCGCVDVYVYMYMYMCVCVCVCVCL